MWARLGPFLKKQQKKTECQNQTRLAVSAAVLLRLAVR